MCANVISVKVAIPCGHETLTLCNDSDLITVVDLEVVKERTRVPSETTQTREEFHRELLKRDVRCAFIGVSAEEGDGIHIIPYKRGTEVRSTFILHWYGIRSFTLLAVTSVVSSNRSQSSKGRGQFE